MPIGRILDHARFPKSNGADELALRLQFRAPLHETSTGSATTRELRWGEDVELMERRTNRTQVRTAGGEDGWVANEHVAEVRRLGRVIRPKKTDYVAPLWRGAEPKPREKRIHDLLWGDELLLLQPPVAGKRARVRARGWTGWLDPDVPMDQAPLLEVYFIDVGQGDGVLIRTPDGRHLLIDGGYTRSKNPTGKSAADFIDWKFFADYAQTRIAVDVMLASHCDADHYGGLWDLLRDDDISRAEIDCEGTDVAAFYHAGVSWWKEGTKRTLGPKQNGHLIRLLGDRADVIACLDNSGTRRLQGEWRDFLERVVAVAPVIERLGVDADEDGAAPAGEAFLPGFGAGESDATVQVLAPVVRRVGGRPAVKSLGVPSQNTNGHSLLLRLSYGAVRVLLTGDLNKNAQRALLGAYEGREEVFACDVAKGCHHGSDDVSYAFLQAVRAAATIISSGDAEGHAHPRPVVVAASALTGHTEIDTKNDDLVTPLVYSTEVERSYQIGFVTRVDTTKYPHEDGVLDLRIYARDASRLEAELRADAEGKKDALSTVHYMETASGALRPSHRDRPFRDSAVVSGIVYGLVNVRTDGETVLCASRNETENGWNVRTFRGRF